jgi:ABC-2 type transport system ATP-binding protein
VNYAEAEPLYPSFLTGLDLVQLYERAKKPVEGQVDELLQLLHVEEYVAQPLGTYSSGMMKKLSIILAFIGQPKMILLDEPLVTVDDASVPVILQLIRDYHENKGVTFLLTSHQAFDESAFAIEHKLQMRDKSLSPW